MATGGLNITSLVTECSVCLESMLSKEPRILTCGHTFCTPCIRKLVSKNPFTCPECRAESIIPKGGVEQIPKNIKFITVCQAMEKLALHSKEPEHDKLCGICYRNGKKVKATHFCEQCPQRLICQPCVDKHSRVSILKLHHIHEIEEDHQVLPSRQCPEHKQPVEYFCMKCQDGLCLDCIYNEVHNDYEGQITDFESGVKALRKEVQIHDDVDKLRIIVRSNMKLMETDLDDMKMAATKLNSLHNSLENNLHQVKEYMKSLVEHEGPLVQTIADFTDLGDTFDVFSENWKKLEKLEDHSYLQKVKQLKEQTEELITKFKEQSDTYTTVKYIPGNEPSHLNVGKLETVCRQMGNMVAPIRELGADKPALVRVIKSGGMVQISYPSEILSVGNGRVFVVCEDSYTLQNVDRNGEVVKEYNTVDRVKSAVLSNGFLCVAVEGNKIIQISLDDSEQREISKLGSTCTLRMAPSDNGIIIAEHRNRGILVEFDLLTKTSTLKVSNLNYPWFVCSGKLGGEYKYVLTEWETKRIIIYNKDWNVVKVITERGGKGFNGPWGNAITPGGKILVADCDGNTISEYDKDGNYMRDLLSYPDIQYPSGVLYDPPYLWVAQWNPAQIKLYRIE